MHRERENLRSAIPSGTYFSAYGMRPPIERQFRRRGVLRLGPANSGVVSFDTADQALQDAEAQVLRESGFEGPSGNWSLSDQLSRLVRNGNEMVTQARLEPYLHTLQIGAGETLIRQGETADAMYLSNERHYRELRCPSECSDAAGTYRRAWHYSWRSGNALHRCPHRFGRH